jgi:hypothetical protein
MTSSAPPDWYPDPANPGFERRWDGSAWIGTPHRTPTSPSVFGPAVDRAYWTNANPPAQIARWAGLAGLALAISGFFATIAQQGGFSARSIVLGILVACAISVVTETAGIVLAATALARSRRGAGAGAAAIQILVASIFLLVTAVVLGVLVLVLLLPLA